MDNSSEKVIERKLVEACKKNGALCIKLLTYQFIGLPDRMCLFPHGKIVFVELKSTGQKPRKIQNVVHKKLEQMGFHVFVIDRVEDIEPLINKMTNKV